MSLLPSRGPETSTRQEGEFEVVGVDEDVAPVLEALASETARDVLNAIYDDPGTPSEIADRLDMSIQKVAYHLEKLEDVDLIAVAGTRYSEKGQEMTVYEPPDDPLVLFVGTEERKSRLRSLVRRVVPTVGVLALGSLAVQRFLGGNGSILPGGSPSGGEAPDGGPDITMTDGGDRTADPPADFTTSSPSTTETAGTPQIGVQSTPTRMPQSTPTQMPQSTPTKMPQSTPTKMPQSTPTPTEIPQSTTVPTQATGQMTDSGAAGGNTSVNVAGDEAVRVAAESVDPGIEPGLAFFLGGLFALVLVGSLWYYRSRGR